MDKFHCCILHRCNAMLVNQRIFIFLFIYEAWFYPLLLLLLLSSNDYRKFLQFWISWNKAIVNYHREKSLLFFSFSAFSLDSGTLGNAGKAPDKGLATKLRPLVKALRDSDKLVQEAATELDAMEWDASKLCRGGGDAPTPTNGPPSTILPPAQPDPLDQLIACARALTEDVRQVASFIQVNIQRNHAFWLGTIEKKRATIYIYIQNYRIFGIQLFLHRSL